MTTAKTIETNPPRTRTCSKLHARQPVGPIPPDIPFPDVVSPSICGESIRSPPAPLVRDELCEITLLRFGSVGPEDLPAQSGHRREAPETSSLWPPPARIGLSRARPFIRPRVGGSLRDHCRDTGRKEAGHFHRRLPLPYLERGEGELAAARPRQGLDQLLLRLHEGAQPERIRVGLGHVCLLRRGEGPPRCLRRRACRHGDFRTPDVDVLLSQGI